MIFKRVAGENQDFVQIWLPYIQIICNIRALMSHLESKGDSLGRMTWSIWAVYPILSEVGRCIIGYP